MRFTICATGGADPDEAWDRYIRPDRWPEWSPQIRSVDCTDSVIRPGTTGTVHGPCGVGADFEVQQVDHRIRWWSWRVEAVRVGLALEHHVDPVGAGTRTTLRIDGPAPIVIGYAPLARLALSRLVRRG